MDCVVAVNNATMGWPSRLDLYGMGECNLVLQHEVCSVVSFANLPNGHTLTRAPEVNPLLRALAVSGAQIAGAGEFRMCGERGVSETPVACSSDEVLELSGRLMTAVRSH